MAIRMKLLTPMRCSKSDGTATTLDAGTICEVVKFYPAKKDYDHMPSWSRAQYDLVHRPTGAELWAFKDEVEEVYDTRDWMADLCDDICKMCFGAVAIVWVMFSLWAWGPQIREGIQQWVSYLTW